MKVNEGVAIHYFSMYIELLGLLILSGRVATVYYYLGRQHIRIVAPVALSEVVINSVTDIAIITDITRLPSMTWDTSCHFYPQIILIKFCDVVMTWTVRTIFKLCAKKVGGKIVKSQQPAAVGL